MARLLLIDDDKRFVELLQTFFNGQGYITEIGFDGQMAVRSALAHKPDLIIMDFQMPMTHGGKAIDYMRRSDALKTVPIIILSGAPEAEIVKALAPYKNVLYLKKPFPLTELDKIVKLALGSGGDDF